MCVLWSLDGVYDVSCLHCRFVEPEENQTLLDILWSDPVNEDRVAEMTGRFG